MKKLMPAILFIGALFAQNNYPIVLIHGFMGWGPEEMGGYNYWGGAKDYVELLKKEGHTVFEVSVGPVSSNWERAIEVYYQLKGGQVDYGKAHASLYNIIQTPKGKFYKGLYPEWSIEAPVHLVGHSMGGQTARMLSFLLTQEILENKENNTKEKSVLLGDIQTGLIKSITSIASPHNGTLQIDIVTKTIPFIQYFVGLASVIGTQFYDFDLDQWSFKRDRGEPWAGYLKRVREHSAWNTKNISSWDLSLNGAKELNGFLQASPDIYYFSFVTSTTVKSEDSKFHIPVPGTSILTRTRSKILGSRNGFWNEGEETTSKWYENDGVVNSCSMYGPTSGVNGEDPIVKYEENELLIPGQWYWTKVENMDHWNIIGHLGNKKRDERSRGLFQAHIKLLSDLPSN